MNFLKIIKKLVFHSVWRWSRRCPPRSQATFIRINFTRKMFICNPITVKINFIKKIILFKKLILLIFHFQVNLMLMDYKNQNDRVLNFEEFTVCSENSLSTFFRLAFYWAGNHGSNKRSWLGEIQTCWWSTHHWERHEESF